MAVKWGNGVLVNKIGYGYVRSDGKINAAWYINNWSSQQINDDTMMTPKTTNQWKNNLDPILHTKMSMVIKLQLILSTSIDIMCHM